MKSTGSLKTEMPGPDLLSPSAPAGAKGFDYDGAPNLSGRERIDAKCNIVVECLVLRNDLLYPWI